MPPKPKWELVPQDQTAPDVVTEADLNLGRKLSDEERQVLALYNEGKYQALAEAALTEFGEQLLERLLTISTARGVSLIEFYTALKNQNREPDAQGPVHKYLLDRMNADLAILDEHTRRGAANVSDTSTRRLTPPPKPEPKAAKKKGILGWGSGS